VGVRAGDVMRCWFVGCKPAALYGMAMKSMGSGSVWRARRGLKGDVG
jgi:hypothetical protein